MLCIACNSLKNNKLIYSNSMASPDDMEGWIMEGSGITEFEDGWMHMYSPEEKFHHVYWCPVNFPESFIAEWEVQNLETDAGLCIVFFSALGKNGEDIFDQSFPVRDGNFSQYINSEKFDCYHISYYANGKARPGREISHLRKNSGFNLVQKGQPGISIKSTSVHKIRLIKKHARISMFVDGRNIIDWIDDGQTYGAVLNGGKIGLRQMQWTHFKYRNFKVWEIE